jgi:hypothetical protein
MGAKEIEAFLTDLAVNQKVAASTQRSLFLNGTVLRWASPKSSTSCHFVFI